MGSVVETVHAVRESLVTSLDNDWAQLSERLDGLTPDEFVWMPVGDGWSVSTDAHGTVLADLVKPDPTPPPFTSIAWRMWHIGPDCLDSYSLRIFGTSGSGIDDRRWTTDPGEARDLLERSFMNFRNGLAGSTADEMLAPIGDKFGPYANANRVDLALHAEREIIHHGAEIGLLRDLYWRLQPS